MTAEPSIESLGPIEFIGIACHGNPATADFHDAWQLFGKVADEASISRIGRDVYGLQIYDPGFPKRFELTYMACVIREPGMSVPIRMISKRVPRCSYAVQRVTGGVPGIDRALKYLYRDFIPSHGYRVALPIDFEKYCNVQDHNTGPERIEVWVPVERA